MRRSTKSSVIGARGTRRGLYVRAEIGSCVGARLRVLNSQTRPPLVCSSLICSGMDDFSLFDQLRACLPCIRRPDIDSDGDDDVEARGARGSAAARPELDRLLFDSDHEATDVEADAMSLHSNVGGRSRRNKKRRRGAGKSIKIFGYDLFGRPRLPDASPEHSEDESSALAPAGLLNLRPGPRPRVTSSTSSAPLDPDAEALPDAAIATLASSPPPFSSTATSHTTPNAASANAKWAAPLTDEQIALEEEQQREKEERKARRAARRLRKQQRAEAEAEAAAGLDGGDPRASSHDQHRGARMNGNEPDNEFEGFPGGNATLARDAVPPKFNDDDFGPWVGQTDGQAPPNSNINPRYNRSRGQSVSASTINDDDEVYDSEEDAADAGGEYNRRSRASGSASGSRSNGESSSRQSRSRGSRSQASSSLIDGSLYATRPRRPQGTSAASRPGHGAQNVPLPPSSAGSYRIDQLPPQFHPSQQPQIPSKKSRSRSSRSAAALSHGGSSSTSQSTSIRSPTQELFPAQIPGIGVESPFGSDFAESLHGGAGDPFTADDELSAAAALAAADGESQSQGQGQGEGGWGYTDGKRVRLLPNLPGLQTRFPSTGFSSGPGSANGSGSGKLRSPFADAQGAAFARSGW